MAAGGNLLSEIKSTVYQDQNPKIWQVIYGTFCIKKNTIYVNFFTKILTVYQS